MQSSVNTFNDYYDYVKGTDSSDDDVDPTDAVLIYNNVNPTCALVYAIALLVSAFILGGYVIYHAGLIPLAIGAIGAVFVVLYSAGKTPISYLPRRTLSVLLNREKARKLYHAIIWLWLIAIILIVGIFFTQGLIMLPFLLLSTYPLLKALRNNPLAPQSRQAAMSQICSVNIALGAWYAAAILASNSVIVC